MADQISLAPRRLPRPLRRPLLTLHIVASVGLLGAVSASLAIAVRAATTDDAALADAAYDLLAMSSAVFGIPLSVVALGTGLAMAIGGPWSVLRTPWVTAKLVLLASVMLNGALILSPALDTVRAGGADLGGRIVASTAWGVLALAAATALSVYRPGRARGRT